MAEKFPEALVLHQDALDALVDMREYDVPYHMRFQIDTDVRCGHWFTVTAKVRDKRLHSKPVARQCLTLKHTVHHAADHGKSGKPLEHAQSLVKPAPSPPDELKQLSLGSWEPVAARSP